MRTLALACLLVPLLSACLDAGAYETRDTNGADGSVPGDVAGTDGTATPDPGGDPGPGLDVPGDAPADPGPIDADVAPPDGDATEPAGMALRSCQTVFSFHPGSTPYAVAVAGAFNGWAPEPMTDPDNDGTYTLAKALAPGLYAYKFVVTDTEGGSADWRFDPANPYRTSDGGVENSGARVGDCTLPLLEAAGVTTTWADGTGSAVARARFVRAEGGAHPASLSASLLKDFVATDVASALTIDEKGRIEVTLSDLAPGKYALVLGALDQNEKPADPVRLVFWIEPQAFDWRDTPLYMIMTDRFVDGEPANNPAPTPGADPSADFRGGDLQGVAQAIEAGVFDKLGVRALWLSPWVKNPVVSHVGSDGVHGVTAYHGYWPAAPREVEPRIGGEAALEAVITAAHAHGMRVLMDFVVNHVYETHPYVTAHPDWFRTLDGGGCLCGATGCDWTEHRLDCLFASYMPDVDWMVPAAAEQMVADALWWLERFELDGLRVDAVKHVPDLAIANLSTRVHEQLETGGVEHFLLGETAMGWGGHDVANSLNDYQTISRYIGPYLLNGQFDFVLYHAVAYHTWAYDDFDGGLTHPDYWLQQSQAHYPAEAIMTSYLGSHDTPRFLSQATYRGQDAAHAKDVPNHQYTDLPQAPTDDEPYRRMEVALTWLLTTPGMPLIYYGDEYGQQGGHDPDNRRMWTPEVYLAIDELAQLDLVRKVGKAREASVALRRGAYTSLKGTVPFLAYARHNGNDVAIVALNHSDQPVTETVAIPPAVPLNDGTVLTNALAPTETLTATDGALIITLPPRSAGVYLP